MKTIHSRRTKMIACLVGMLAPALAVQAGQGDNAALLYYQAFLLYEKPDAALDEMMSDFRAGKIASNETIREHIERNRRVIELAVKAANTPKCDWGYDYSQGIALTVPHTQTIAYLLLTEARLLAEQGDYQPALDRCMTTHKMALHAVDKLLVTYLIGIAISGATNRTTQQMLPAVPGDVEALNRFKTQLSQIQNEFPSLEGALIQESQVCVTTMRKDKTQVIVREMDDSAFADSPIGKQLLAGDEAFFERNRTHWFKAIATLTSTLKSGQPYPQMYATLRDLGQKLGGEWKENPDATLTGISLAATERIYLLATRLQTHFNAVETAIDLYVTRARTGKLPDTLPAGSPPDLFSGKPFAYEKTADRFILRCQAKEEPEKAEANQYEFKLRP